MFEKMLALVLFITITDIIVMGTPVEHCPGLHRIKDLLSRDPNKLVHLTCRVLPRCGGVDCDGRAGTKPFAFTLKAEFCKPPLHINMTITKPSHHHITLLNEKKVYQSIPPIRFVIIPHFTRIGDHVLAKLDICVPLPLISTCIPSWPISANITVRKEVCDGKGHGSPSGKPPVGTTKALPGRVSTTKRPQTGEMKTTKMTPRTGHGAGTSGSGGTKPSGTVPTTKKIGTTKKGAAGTTKKGEHTTRRGGYTGGTGYPGTTAMPRPTGHGKRSSSGLSTGGKVAVISSAVLIFVVLIGLFVYCRRLKSRKPAFYNDIAINDPLRGEMYEGDDEPLFNSHLVL